MELIVGHEHTDFDSLAASVLARHLWPKAVVAVGRRHGKSVYDYLPLHKDALDIARCDDLDLGQVVRLIVVDTKAHGRLPHVESVLARRDSGEGVELIVYDHHPTTDHDISADRTSSEKLGAVTTMLTEEVRRRGASLTPCEATLAALGIYADTAALTLSSTTSRDANAVAWLLEEGAQLEVVRHFLKPPFSAQQLRVLRRVLADEHREQFGPLEIIIACVDVEEHVDGLADVAMEAFRLEQPDALFVLAMVRGRKVQIIGRSGNPNVDVGQIMRTLGGGGHQGAGSTILKGVSLDAARTRVAQEIHGDPDSVRRVKDFMTQPAQSVAPEVSLSNLSSVLAQKGFSGAPVLRDGRLVGVVSRRDFERAHRAGKASLPVASHMSTHPLTVGPDERLEVALRMMTLRDVGRVVVMDGERPIGILTRSDALRALYGGMLA